MSVAWAAVSGTASLTVGVLDHSLAIVGVGLNLFGDLAGSLVLIGQRKALAMAVRNNRTENRFSGLLARLIA